MCKFFQSLWKSLWCDHEWDLGQPVDTGAAFDQERKIMYCCKKCDSIDLRPL